MTHSLLVLVNKYYSSMKGKVMGTSLNQIYFHKKVRVPIVLPLISFFAYKKNVLPQKKNWGDHYKIVPK